MFAETNLSSWKLTKSRVYHALASADGMEARDCYKRQIQWPYLLRKNMRRDYPSNRVIASSLNATLVQVFCR